MNIYQQQQLAQAIAYKAARILVLNQSPTGVMSEWDMPQRIGKDWTIKEMLFGLRYQELVDEVGAPLDFESGFISNTAITEALGEPIVNTWTAEDLNEARDAAIAWVITYLSGYGVSTGASI